MAVKATSLSELNQLAAFPPQYPHNPTEEIRNPLTLYISRVPGTRDIILSTFKPLRKNVTAEDVANAFYYVHLDLPSDSLLVSPTPAAHNAASPRSSIDGPPAHIQRKPLPNGSSVAQAAPPPPPVAAPSTLPSAASSPPSPPTHQLPVQPLQPLQHLQPPEATDPDKPPKLPPRPKEEPWIPPGYLLDQGHMPPPMSTLRNSISRKPVGSRPSHPPPVAAPAAAPAVSGLAPAAVLPPSPPVRSQSPILVPFQLTLIRRDPSSNHQWNIGKISSLQPAEPVLHNDSYDSLGSPERRPRADSPVRSPPHSPQHSPIHSPVHSPGHPPHHPPHRSDSPPPVICIQLDTSGYAKFRGFPSRQSIESASRDMFGPPRQLSTAAAAAAAAEADMRDNRSVRSMQISRDPVDAVFSRNVVMSYGKSWKANIRNAFRRHDRAVSDTGPTSEAEQAAGGGNTAGNTFLSPKAASGPAVVETPLITRPGPGLKPRGYVFTSPWDGQCEFRTGNGGRSLKCRHFVRSAGSGSLNPLVVAQGLRDGQGMAAVAGGGRARAGSLTSVVTGAMPVSELRFNLPSSSHSGGRAADLQAWAAHQRRPSDEDDYDDYDSDEAPAVLAVGREAAGGGNRGNRAKLGKLIIFHEGFKMLDLVVAANIGMWWVSWERSF